MTAEEKAIRIDYLWRLARIYYEKLCFKLRLQKMHEYEVK